jgi:hypothetical protein
MLQLIVLCKPGDSSAVVFYAFQGYVYLKNKKIDFISTI